ncbi:MAG: hypothetical protein J6Z45_00305 [Oscillospiraceae bacterium]|nr:hypothetical protein [Oscillospiraceae bacterium]
MNYTKKILSVLMAASMTLPAFACNKDSSKPESTAANTQPAESLEIKTDENKGIQMDLEFKEIENVANNSETEPVATVAVGTDGSLYVQKTDINKQLVTQENGSAATELYTGTTLATKVPNPEYTPDYKTYFSMWLDTTKKADFVFDGEFLVYKIKISEDAQDGVYPIQIYKDDVSNYDGKTLKIVSNPGYICINSDEPTPSHNTDGDLVLNGSVVSGKPGDTVDFVLKTEKNPGFVGFRLWMSFDANIFKITRASAGKDFETTAGLNGRTVD